MLGGDVMVGLRPKLVSSLGWGSPMGQVAFFLPLTHESIGPISYQYKKTTMSCLNNGFCDKMKKILFLREYATPYFIDIMSREEMSRD